MTIFRPKGAGTQSSAVDEYLKAKRREFIAASGDDIGEADAEVLRADLERMGTRIEYQLDTIGRQNVCYLAMGRVQSGKTGHQLGMLAWAADRCDVAVIFTGVTEALNGQTSYRIAADLGSLPSNPVTALNVPTRATAERDRSFLDSVIKRTRQRREFRAGGGIWPERLPILVAMKTRPRVDALKWMFQEVASELGQGVTALIIDDEADQASPNAATRKGEEAATYSELKSLRDAATRHVWLSYTATPQAIYLTELDGALRPDFCAVTRPGQGYFGVGSLMSDGNALARMTIADWSTNRSSAIPPPPSLLRALCDLLAAGWLRLELPDLFYRHADGTIASEGMRSVQMLVHTSSKVSDHSIDYAQVEAGLAAIRSGVEAAVRAEDYTMCPTELADAWEALSKRVSTRVDGSELPALDVAQLWSLGNLVSRVEMRVVNSDTNRPTVQAGPLPNARQGWEAHPIWVVIGGDILGRGLTIPQLVTTYFTRLANASNEDTVSQQMRFCGYRQTYSHVLSVHALSDIFDSFAYLAQVERALVSTAEEWDQQDKNLRLDEPALWYVSRPSNRMKPTRLAVRDRELVDISRSEQVLSLRQFVQPSAFRRNARVVLDWVASRGPGPDTDWVGVECDADEMRELLAMLTMAGADDGDRELAIELLNPRLGELGLSGLPFVGFVRGLDSLTAAASGRPPALNDLPVRRLSVDPGADAHRVWRDAWDDASGFTEERWFDVARLGVQHVGDAQRRPIESLSYDAVCAVIEPVAVYASNQSDRLGAGVAVSVIAPHGYEIRTIGVRTRS